MYRNWTKSSTLSAVHGVLQRQEFGSNNGLANAFVNFSLSVPISNGSHGVSSDATKMNLLKNRDLRAVLWKYNSLKMIALLENIVKIRKIWNILFGLTEMKRLVPE